MSKDNEEMEGIKEKKPRKGLANIASKLGIGKKKDAEQSDDNGNGNHGGNGDKPQLTADMIEIIQQAAASQGMATSPEGVKPRMPLDPETAIKLLDYLCHPESERAAELTNLTHVQSHAFSINRIFEEAIKDHGDFIPDPTEIFRKSVYGHRRSVNALFLKELTELAGLQSQDEAIKSQGIGSGLPQG